MRFHRHKTRRINQQKVLLAVYFAADDEGLFCTATNDEIGRIAKLTGLTVKSYLGQLEDGGVIAIFRPGYYRVARRVIVIRDHPAAHEEIHRLRRMVVMRSYPRPTEA